MSMQSFVFKVIDIQNAWSMFLNLRFMETTNAWCENDFYRMNYLV